MRDVTGNFIFYIFSLLASKFWKRNCLHLLFFFRRHYIKKCEQMFKLQTEQDAEQV